MMFRTAGLAVALAAGCPATEVVPTGETAVPYVTEGCGTETGGPVVVTRASVSCVDSDTVRFEVEASAWARGGLIFSQETAATGAQWSDEHDVVSTAFDPCGTWDVLTRELATGFSMDNWSVNDSTVFECTQFDGSGMTYAARVYDLDGNFASCVAWGHDVPGLLGGAYERVNEPAAANELVSCVPGAPTR